MFGNSAPFSYSQGAFLQEDPPQQRRGFQQDDLRGAPLQRNNMSRPSGRSIYKQRKEYSESLNRNPDNFNVRVEHLFTCELDGQEMRTLNDCVAKLKRLDTKGRLWPQQMIMEVQGGYLLLNDIETKAELESLPLSSIQQTTAVLDSCAYDSLLTITVQDPSKNIDQVFMFQCEETGAELIKSDLDKFIQKGSNRVEPRKEQQPDIRSNLENIIGQYTSGSSFRQVGPRAVQREMTPPPQDHLPPQWGNNREPDNMPPSRAYSPQEEMLHYPDLHELQSSPEVALPPEQTDSERNMDILNHVLNDLEIFTDKVGTASNAPSQQDKSKKKNKKEKKKSQQNAVALPPLGEYFACLQKIKYGFNLLSQLDGILSNPSAPDYVHIFFTILGAIVPQYPADLPPNVVSPLLTDMTVHFLGQVVNPQEDHMWRTLGESWNVPRSKWPDGDVPPYIPEFYDGWQPPAPSRRLSPFPPQNGPMSRSNSQRFPSDRPNGQINDNQSYPPVGMQEPVSNNQWGGSPPPFRSNEPPLKMRVIYDFMARNNQELSVMKGEVIEVIQKSKQWWLVRNSRGQDGNIPQNVLEQLNSAGPMENMRDTRGPVTLDMTSTPADVRAWLEYKGFSKITVSSLGVLTGQLLLGMTKDEIRTVCPEEGGKVFFQLQAVKSAIALASEPSGPYNGRY